MPEPADLLFSLDFALRQKLRPRVKWQGEYASRAAAQAILAHLELCGYEVVNKERPKEAGYFPHVEKT
jgi:hypothetical protein